MRVYDGNKEILMSEQNLSLHRHYYLPLLPSNKLLKILSDIINETEVSVDVLPTQWSIQ